MTRSHTHFAAAIFALCGVAHAEKLTLNVAAMPAMSAVAMDTLSGKKFVGTMSGEKFVFDLPPSRHYDVLLTRPGGGMVRLLDLSWYSDEPAPADAGPLSDDDKAQIAQVLTGIARFTNHNKIVSLSGNDQRAVALLDLRRDNDFHSRQGSEVIQRVEIWYFKNEAGGWAKVQQQDRVVDRQRYPSTDDFEKAMAGITWLPVSSGLGIVRGQDSTVTIDPAATTQPSQ